MRYEEREVTAENFKAIAMWCGADLPFIGDHMLLGKVPVNIGDWVTKNPHGVFYSCTAQTHKAMKDQIK